MLNKGIANGIPAIVHIPFVCFRCRLASAAAATRVRRQYHASQPKLLLNSSNLRVSTVTSSQEPESEASLDAPRPESQSLSPNTEPVASTTPDDKAEIGLGKSTLRKKRLKERGKTRVRRISPKLVRHELSNLRVRRVQPKLVRKGLSISKLDITQVHIDKELSGDKLDLTQVGVRRSTGRRARNLDTKVLHESENGHSDLEKGQTLNDALRRRPKPELTGSIKTGDISLIPLDIERKPVPRLAYGLSRTLFNPGVLELRDRRSRVYNFDPYLEKIVPVAEFDFKTLKQFTTASKDPTLLSVARRFQKKYVGSSSSMTGLLKHFHYLISGWRPPQLDMLSSKYPVQKDPTFTKIQRGPEAAFLRWKGGAYALDSDKQYDDANILSMMGQYMEKLLTVDKEVFEKHRVGNSHQLSKEERSTVDSYHYSTVGDFVMRSQLDAYDPRLPGTGMFDLKTRAVLPIRMDTKNFQWGTEYEIQQHRGEYHSFEREYHDMIRATMLKYSLQVRMGRMDGIFVAYHNITRIFGFQYVSLAEIDEALHGQSDPCLGDQEFLFSLHILNDFLRRATEKFPKQSLRLHIESRPSEKVLEKSFMYFFAEPVTEEEMNTIQNLNKAKIQAWEKKILGLDVPVEGSEIGAVKSKIDIPGESSSQSLPIGSAPQDDGSQTSKYAEGQDDVVDLEADTPSSQSSGKSDSAQSSETGSKGPLMGALITIKSLVNDRPTIRPENLTRDDKWEVQYDIAEFTSPEKAWNLYNACKTRRKSLLEKASHELHQSNDFFMQLIQKATAESSKWRAEMDANDKGKPIRMWNDDGIDANEMTPAIAPKEQPSSNGLAKRIFNTFKSWTGGVVPDTGTTNALENAQGLLRSTESPTIEVRYTNQHPKIRNEKGGRSPGSKSEENVSAFTPVDDVIISSSTDAKSIKPIVDGPKNRIDTKTSTLSRPTSKQSTEHIVQGFPNGMILERIKSTTDTKPGINGVMPQITSIPELLKRVHAVRRKSLQDQAVNFPDSPEGSNRIDSKGNLVRNRKNPKKISTTDLSMGNDVMANADRKAKNIIFRDQSLSKRAIPGLTSNGSKAEPQVEESQLNKDLAEVFPVAQDANTEVAPVAEQGADNLVIGSLLKLIEDQARELTWLRQRKSKAPTSPQEVQALAVAPTKAANDKMKKDIISSVKKSLLKVNSVKKFPASVKVGSRVAKRILLGERAKALKEREVEESHNDAKQAVKDDGRAEVKSTHDRNPDVEMLVDLVETECNAIKIASKSVRRDLLNLKTQRSRIVELAAVAASEPTPQSVVEAR